MRENVQFFIRGNIKYLADGKERRKADTRRLYKRIQNIEVNMKPEESCIVSAATACRQLFFSFLFL